MHSIELTSLAATFVRTAESQLALGTAVDKRAAESYWLAARYRHEFWSGRLADHRAAIQRPGISHRHACWQEILPVLQEVLISEPLTRCLAYQAKILEEFGIDQDLAGLASSALGAHLESRHRCLHLIVFGTGLSPELAVALNRLRRLMEHFNDQLLILLRPIDGLPTYAFDCQTTAISQRQLGLARTSAFLRSLHTCVLRSWLASTCSREYGLSAKPANPRLNTLMSRAVLQMLPHELFDSFGLPRSRETLRAGQPGLESDGNQLDASQPDVLPLNLLSASHPRHAQLEPDDRRW